MPTNTETISTRIDQAASVGMQPAVWAETQPDRIAIYDYTGQNRTFAELNINANRIARLLREAGLSPGDSVALLCSNRAEFCDVVLAALRTGVRCTPANWHLTVGEIAYIVKDCEARALFADARVTEAVETAAPQCPDLVLRISIGGDIAGFNPFEEALVPFDGSNISDPIPQDLNQRGERPGHLSG